MFAMESVRFQRLRVPLITVVLALALSERALAVASYARQTGMACSACHTVFPELAPFGREFKLNGYVLDNVAQWSSPHLSRT
jgi:hypothetical protein